MDDFTKYLHYQKEITAHKLKTINRYLKKEVEPHRKRTSQINIVENVLQIAGRPLHISEIIEIANGTECISIASGRLCDGLKGRVV